jgi:hypothetical protein
MKQAGRHTHLSNRNHRANRKVLKIIRMQRWMTYDFRKFAKVATADCGRGSLKKVYLIAGFRGGGRVLIDL